MVFNSINEIHLSYLKFQECTAVELIMQVTDLDKFISRLLE